MSLKSFLNRVKQIVFSKYFIVLAIFFVFFLFFDKHNLLSRWRVGRNVKKLEQEIKFYEEEIEDNKQKVIDMRAGEEALEKYAREQYFLKKDSEDIFIVKEKDE